MNTYSANVSDQALAAVSSLATDLADVISGYRTMIGKAEGDLIPVVERLLALHEAHAARVMEMLVELGGDPEQAGSFMGTVHSAVAHARDLTGTLDGSAIDNVLDGEGHILDSYRDALSGTEGHPEISGEISKQYQALREHVAALRE